MGDCFLECVFVEAGSVDLVAREENIKLGSDFAAFVEFFSFLVGEIEAEALFGNMVSAQFAAEAENVAQEVSAHFHCGLTDPSFVFGRRFNDDDI